MSRLLSGTTVHALTQTNYDNLGRPRCVAQRMNPAEFASPPTDVCKPGTAGSYGPDRITRTTYDEVSRPTLVETGVDVSGVEADEVATTYTRERPGEPPSPTRKGNRTTYEYDVHDRLRNTRFPSPTTDGVSAPTSGTGADYEQLGYDANGNVVSRRLRDGQSIGYGYDNLDRLTLKNVPDATWQLDVTYAYDNLGRPVSASRRLRPYPGDRL